MAANPTANSEEPRPFLVVLTGPVLNFLAAQEQKRIERGESDEKRISFWPFAVAGIGLFGLGIAGGNAFMSGSVSAGEEVADAAAQQQQQQQQQQAKPGRRRAGAESLKPQPATPTVKVEQVVSEANRKGAVRAAGASLALGTLLACTGAAILVKATQHYLEVKDAAEFAAYMRSKLPDRARAVTEAVNLEAKKSGLSDWFRTSLGVAKYVEDKETARRVKQLQVIKDKGMLTDKEFHNEKRRILDEGLQASTS
eukprot:CAMPEP_0177717846 /NCGR_PEP_ID=MMETSP0484_2-20121128/15260_1 /TAXON_ID=354590 /ORGANISM="Rhodomonas lens, Strain RHODO" /LENGTH=253 /DNA_ID=CAMNT_0019229969 /DNA_START=35 /DNA_END=796 /DNA_ORIENTATION=+